MDNEYILYSGYGLVLVWFCGYGNANGRENLQEHSLCVTYNRYESSFKLYLSVTSKTPFCAK